MNKGELVDNISRLSEMTKRDSERVLDATLQSIQEAVGNGDKVTLVGFGTFEARDRAAREGRNPQTGAKMSIPATRVPAFSAGKLFKDRVSGSGSDSAAT